MALTSLTTVDLLSNERALVVKETIAGYYRPFSYYLSKGAVVLSVRFEIAIELSLVNYCLRIYEVPGFLLPGLCSKLAVSGCGKYPGPLTYPVCPCQKMLLEHSERGGS